MGSHVETPVYNPMYTPLYTPLHRPSTPPPRVPTQYGVVCRAIVKTFTTLARLVSGLMHALIRLAVTIGAVLLFMPSSLHGQQRMSNNTSSNVPSSAFRNAIAARPIARGTVLTAADIQWNDSATSPATRRADTTARVSEGWVARRAIRAGEPLTPPAVSRAEMVASGDAVNVLYRDDVVTLKMKGTAIGNGAEGDKIYVRLDNRRRFRAVVTGPNAVTIVL
jgi:flagella basal body P-ring formation protein FlgA